MFIKNQPSVEGSLKKTESDGGGGFGGVWDWGG